MVAVTTPFTCGAHASVTIAMRCIASASDDKVGGLMPLPQEAQQALLSPRASAPARPHHSDAPPTPCNFRPSRRNSGIADPVLHRLPPGEVLAAWGQSIAVGGPEWRSDATQDAAAQAMQFGMHNDGMHFFPFTSRDGLSSEHGLLCVNHEYTHEEIFHGAEKLAGGVGVTLAKVRKSQAAHGVSVNEVRRSGGQWQVIMGSFGRRITANTPMRIAGPAASHALMKSRKFDLATAIQVGVNDGYSAFGTANNCNILRSG